MEIAHRGGAGLTAEETEHILTFMLTLSDSACIKDPAFRDPWADAETE